MLKLKLQCFGHLMWRTDSLEETLTLGKIEGRRRRGQQRMRWLDRHVFEQALGLGDGQGSLACCSPWGHKNSDMTEQLNWTEQTINAGETVEKREPSHTVGGNVNWYTHYGEWYGDSFKNWKQSYHVVVIWLLSRVWLFATWGTVAHQASPSMEFSRQEYWSGLPFPFPGDLPDPGIKPRSPALQAGSELPYDTKSHSWAYIQRWKVMERDKLGG